METKRDRANRGDVNERLDDERFSRDYTAEEDELYSDEMELTDELDEVDEPNSGEGYPERDYPEDDVPVNVEEDDLEDDSTEYAEGELHDEQRNAEKIVNDLDLGEALYYEKDLDYHHIDGTSDEEDGELDEEEAFELEDEDLEERLIREQIDDENEEEDEEDTEY